MKTIFLNRFSMAAIAIFMSAFFFTSCQKENSTAAPADELTAEQAADLTDESTQANAVM